MDWLREQVAWWRDRIDLSALVRRGLRIGAAGSAGFTLLELLIVMAVIGILAAIVVFSLQGVKSSATVAACQSDFATASEAVDAYQVQLGAFPGGTGSSTVTDSDAATPPNFTPGAAPSGVNAARAGGELLVSGSTSPNVNGTDKAGPWLKEPPDREGSYSIWVANDGTGLVQVLDAAGHVPVGATHTAKDCSIISGGGGALTATANAAPSTTTTSTAPPTTTTSAPPTTTSTTSAPTTTTTAPHNQAPVFTSDDATTFRHGVFDSFTVTVSGSPRPSLRLSGSLPFGVTFNHTDGVLSGIPRKSGHYRLTLTASNGIRPNASERFMLIVD